jgi:hypothetical protein
MGGFRPPTRFIQANDRRSGFGSQRVPASRDAAAVTSASFFIASTPPPA